ncbi:Esterase ybfF [Pseudoalteromonas luteoviolacea B = ATCC 29581]|nr:Esterase ybfF [Pseudoalteromonas luteoviolacea B = ATCC 29581]
MLLNYQLHNEHLLQSRPAVVLIHGLFGSLENLNVIAKALAEHFVVINLDLRNHGLSAHSPLHSYPAMAQDVLDTLAHLAINKAHFVGHSMGGKVAMQIAHIAPNIVEKLVILDIAPVSYHSRHEAIFNGLFAVANEKIVTRKQADEILARFINEVGVRQFLLKSLVKNDEGVLNWRFNIHTIHQEYGKILSNIDANDSCLCETLFIKGSMSDYILIEHKEVIAKLFSNAKGKVIHGVGHWLHAEKPVAVNKAIIDFLQ